MFVSTHSGTLSGPTKMVARSTPASCGRHRHLGSRLSFSLYFFPHVPISDLQGQKPKPLLGLGKREARARCWSAMALAELGAQPQGLGQVSSERPRPHHRRRSQDSSTEWGCLLAQLRCPGLDGTCL